MASIEILFLGSGTSTGVPMIGCDCPTCKSADSRDKRLRSSIHVTFDDFHLQIDTTPDLRLQALRADIRHIDAILITHPHVDHLFGLDEIRRFNTIQGNEPIPLYACPETIAAINRIFPYLFTECPSGLYRAKIDFTPTSGAFEVTPGVRVTPFDVVHGNLRTQGYRIDRGDKSFAYIPDCRDIPESSLKLLRDLDLLIIDGLRIRQHTTHVSFDESRALIERIAPTRALITHIAHDCTHEQICEMMPPSIRPAYDGLALSL